MDLSCTQVDRPLTFKLLFRLYKPNQEKRLRSPEEKAAVARNAECKYLNYQFNSDKLMLEV